MRAICTSIVATLSWGMALALAGPSFAATINVPDDYATIQGAINASSNGDVISIAAGTYYEHALNPNGKAITIQGTLNGDGTLATTIDAQQGGRVFTINQGTYSTVIKDLVMTGGTAELGGAVKVGIGSFPTITGCTIEGNAAQNSGGGIYIDGTSLAIITDCFISSNTALLGGGIYINDIGRPTITGCTIEGNSANNGGGIFNKGWSEPIVFDCTISSNSAKTNGGGMHNAQQSTVKVNQSEIFNNTAGGLGGGINNQGVTTINNSTLCGNTPNQVQDDHGGGGNCIQEICTDTDQDGVLDECDGCPNDPLKSAPGDCGCGVLETDTDADGTPDCIDGCPEDPLKIEPGDCGCGTQDTNVYGDVDCDGDYDIDDIYAGMAHFGIDTGPTGACCANSGCHAITEEGCEGMGGTWLGEGVSCDDCPAPCPGDTDGNGVINIEDLLNLIGAWGACP